MPISSHVFASTSVVLNTFEDLVYIKNEKLEWVLINRSFADVFGCKSNVVLNSCDSSFLPKELVEIFELEESEVLRTKQSRYSQHEGIWLGEKRLLGAKRSPLIINSKQFVIGVLKDLRGQHDLEESNITLKNVLAAIERDKVAVQETMAVNVEKTIKPIIAKMRKVKKIDNRAFDVLEDAIEALTSDFYRKIASYRYNLTETEIKVSQMIKRGYRTREISKLLGISNFTVGEHRASIRLKLGLKNSGVNLRTFLNEMPD